MEYREATEADAPLLAEINRQLIEHEWGSAQQSVEMLQERMRCWIAEGDYRALLFVEGGDDVAYALLTADEESAYIRHFFVRHAFRGSGAGRRAIELLFREVIPPTARVTLDVLASNESGYRFWRSVGFADYTIRMERLPSAGDGVGGAAAAADAAGGVVQSHA